MTSLSLGENMTGRFLTWLKSLVAAGDVHPFYVTGEWRALSAEVLRIDRYECQLCKAKGRYRRAALVHHVNHVKHRPDLALDIYYVDSDSEQKRNLLSVCRWCHENECHPERLCKTKVLQFMTEERWD